MVLGAPSFHKSVAVVEDDPDCAAAVRGEVARAGWDCVVFHSAAEALHAAQAGPFPALVIMDLGLPREDAMAAIAALTQMESTRAVIALTGHAGDDYLFRALKAGAVGYVLKTDGLGRVAEVLEEVVRGGAPMSPNIARRVVSTFRATPADPLHRLTERERDVLNALGAGYTYAGVAGLLGVSIDTVRQHVRNLYRKLHASSKAEAIAVAMRAGWIR